MVNSIKSSCPAFFSRRGIVYRDLKPENLLVDSEVRPICLLFYSFIRLIVSSFSSLAPNMPYNVIISCFSEKMLLIFAVVVETLENQ